MSHFSPNAEHPQPSNSPTSLPVAPEHGNIPADQGETRRWYYSPSTLQHERELLQKYGVQDFSGLLTEAHFLLAGLTKVMKGFNHDIRVKGHVISNLGSLLEQSATLVSRMQHIYSKVKQV